MLVAAVGAISPRATAARTADSACRTSSAVRNDDRSIPRCFVGLMEGKGRRQYLRGEKPQQMRPAVDQVRQRPRAQRSGDEIGHASPRIGDAARTAPRIAGASYGETPVYIARDATRDQGQPIEIPRFGVRKTGDNRKDRTDRQLFPTSAAPGRNEASMSVHHMFHSRAAAPGAASPAGHRHWHNQRLPAYPPKFFANGGTQKVHSTVTVMSVWNARVAFRLRYLIGRRAKT
jgi:hypothetical protein